MIYKLASQGEQNFAIRFSEFEDINTVLNMKNLVKWVWIDCFTKIGVKNQIGRRIIAAKRMHIKNAEIFSDLINLFTFLYNG